MKRSQKFSTLNSLNFGLDKGSILPCRIYRPNDKAKVESGIKYVKCNFFLGRTFSSGDNLDTQLKYWLDHTCNQRMHGTIRKIPREVFESEEKAKLRPLPIESLFQNSAKIKFPR